MTTYTDQIISAICEIDELQSPAKITQDTRFEADLGFDSGGFIELFLILEETIPNFTLGAARLERDDFETIAKLAAFVSRRMSFQEDAA